MERLVTENRYFSTMDSATPFLTSCISSQENKMQEKQRALNLLRHALHYVWARHDEDAAQILARCFIGVLYGG